MQDFLSGIEIPRNRILFIHARVKGLVPGLAYPQAAEALLEALRDCFQPRGILVPTYTYSFTKSGRYDVRHTPSEVGRFSEEVRLLMGLRRTLDPIFNVIDVDGILNGRNIDYRSAFGINSLFDYLHQENAIGVNINLETIISTQLHYVEAVSRVPYRFNKVFHGRIWNETGTCREVAYEYLVRDLERDPKWDRARISRDLVDAGVLNPTTRHKCELTWMAARDLYSFISERLQDNPEYLLVRQS